MRAGVSPDEAIVIGSGILNALGIRKSSDVDVALPEEEFKNLIQNPHFIKSRKFNDDYFEGVDEDIEVWPYWWNYKDDSVIPYETLRENTVLIEGVRYVSLPFLRQWKIWRAREKDLADVVLIDAYLRGRDE